MDLRAGVLMHLLSDISISVSVYEQFQFGIGIMGKIGPGNRGLPYIFAAREFPGHSFFPISVMEVNLPKYVVVSRF